MASLYVVIDFALDFVAEDYNITDSNLIGTLLYNIGNIMQTHYHDVTYAWVRSYDSFYKVNSDDVIRLSGLKANGMSILIGGYSSFEAGWEAAVDFSKDHTYMDNNEYERIVVDLLADWNANEKGEFVKSSSDGFKNSTIYVPSETYITINLNQHTINRGLGDRNELDGEVIFVAEEANLIINGGTISGGNSDNGAGGIHVDDEATVTLNNVHVKGNTVDGDDGGGIALYDGATLIMNGGSISDNRNNSFNACYGAGVYVYESTATFEGVTFRNNQNTYNPMLGTGLYADEDSVVTMNNCIVVDNGTFNETIGTEGSISLISIEGDSSVDIKNTEFRGNGYADSEHDSVNTLIYVTNTSHFLIDNCTFKNNSAEYILSALDDNFDVVNTRFLDNSANVFYGYADDSITFTDCEFNNNSGNQWMGYYSFNFSSRNSKVKFVNCSFGNSTYNDRSRATFEDDSKFPASIFGEGSLALIVASVALIASIASIIVNVTERKKKTVPVTATEQSEDDE
jgi:hypothetical protein